MKISFFGVSVLVTFILAAFSVDSNSELLDLATFVSAGVAFTFAAFRDGSKWAGLFWKNCHGVVCMNEYVSVDDYNDMVAEANLTIDAQSDTIAKMHRELCANNTPVEAKKTKVAVKKTKSPAKKVTVKKTKKA